MVHGLAASIRAALESETFDLGGQNVDTIKSTIKSAFENPFTLEEMIRVTFVTGAGKQARSKYDDGAAKAVTSVLKDYGYDEDRGASCVMECAGTFKLQHDTGKNLKTVVVFPKVEVATKNGGGNGKSSNVGSKKTESLLPESSPEYKLAVSSLALFTSMVSNRCPSWSQKKGCIGAIEEVRKLVESLEATLMKGTSLNDSEQAFYDSVVALDDKEAHLRHELHEDVETGNLRTFELELLKSQNAERIATLQKEKKPTAKALERKELLDKLDPIAPEKLRNHAQIGKLRKELQPLLQIEARSRGRLLSMKETKAMARKDDILEEINHLEETSRGWFEDEEIFESRLEASRKEFAANARTKSLSGEKLSAIGADTKVKVSLGKFVLPGEANKGWSKAKGKKKGKLKAGAVFSTAAMVMDSSDDDDDDSDEDDQVEEVDHSDHLKSEVERDNKNANSSTPKSTVAGTSGETGQGSPKRKSKKKKKKSKPNQGTGQGLKEEETTGAIQTPSENFLLSLLVSLIGSIIAFFFGKPKKKRR